MSDIKHNGTLDDLQTMIRGCGFNVQSVKDQEYGHQIRTTEGAIINWYTTTGTVSIQGKKPVRDRLTSAWESFTGSPAEEPVVATIDVATKDPVSPSNVQPANKKVFVVHGHDDVAREQLELILHKLGLNPFILANTGGGGLTIIEALEKEIGPRADQARFGLVLLTPDDIGYAKRDGADMAQPRSRQNVVLEMGMLIAAIGRPNVAILKKGHIEVPSDAQGILYIPFNDHVKETVPKLADRLRAAGFVLNPAAITNASS